MPLNRHWANPQPFSIFLQFWEAPSVMRVVVCFPLEEMVDQSTSLKCSFNYSSLEGVLLFCEASIEWLGFGIVESSSVPSNPTLGFEQRGEGTIQGSSPLRGLFLGYFVIWEDCLSSGLIPGTAKRRGNRFTTLPFFSLLHFLLLH